MKRLSNEVNRWDLKCLQMVKLQKFNLSSFGASLIYNGRCFAFVSQLIVTLLSVLAPSEEQLSILRVGLLLLPHSFLARGWPCTKAEAFRAALSPWLGKALQEWSCSSGKVHGNPGIFCWASDKRKGLYSNGLRKMYPLSWWQHILNECNLGSKSTRKRMKRKTDRELSAGGLTRPLSQGAQEMIGSWVLVASPDFWVKLLWTLIF